MIKKSTFVPVALGALLLLAGCGPTLKGIVVLPDGTPIKGLEVGVHSKPWSDSVKVKDDGSFVLKKIEPKNVYTLIAEDAEGNMGIVKNFSPSEKPNEKVIIKLSKELEAKDAVIDGDLFIQQDTGPGEKIFKSSQ